MRDTDDELRSFLKNENVDGEIDYLPFGKDSIRLVRTYVQSKDTLDYVIFIHGAPGSSDAFYDYLVDADLLGKANLVSYDRPGYGYSDYGNPLVDIEEQADIVSQIIKHYDIAKVVLVSHSYGCAIAAVASVNESEKVLANIMVSPVIDPDNEKIFFYSPLPSLSILKHLFSGAMQVASYEKMSHAGELKDIEKLWSQLSVPSILMHGAEDWLAPIENATYLNDKVDAELLKVDLDENASHFIIWEQKNKVVQNILAYL